LETSSIPVLVVDDSEPFRRFVCSIVQAIPNMQIMFEVSDGLEAVRKAEELQQLDRATEGEHPMEVLRRPSESTGKMNWKETGQTDRGAESLDSITLRITAGQTGFLSGGCLARGYHPLH
jgi:CheY-like chemotaxis protein